MLDLKVTIEGKDVVIQGLGSMAREFPNAIRRGLKNIGRGIFAESFKLLSGPGAQKSHIPGGGYPVPVRTGHLRRQLAFLEPGQSKSGEVGTFSAGDMETVVFDAASYAPAIFLGLGSSSPYGERDAVRDALLFFDMGGQIKQSIEDEIQKELNKT